jgi:uncharacterized circularly permuted ATP-grasp superfamily protein
MISVNPKGAKMTTFKQAQTFIRLCGITMNRTEAGDFRVAFRKDQVQCPEASAYYTNDLDDAVQTALAMVGAQRVPERKV